MLYTTFDNNSRRFFHFPLPSPRPAKDLIILFKLLARERGQIEVIWKICAQIKVESTQKTLGTLPNVTEGNSGTYLWGSYRWSFT